MLKQLWNGRRGRKTGSTNAKAHRETGVIVDALERRTLFAVLPAGFTETVVADGLAAVTAMEFSPDGKLYVGSQLGAMEVWKDGAKLQEDFFRDQPLPTQNFSERGLLGIAFDPNYATNRFVYVYYTTTASDNHNRVSRFTANATGDLAIAGSEDVIMELDSHSAGNHNGGAIHFGPDRLLYIATGDNAQGATSQQLTNRHGKMLRVDVRGDDFPADPGQDYAIPAGNPTTFDGVAGSTAGVNRSIIAIGFRNPFTFAFKPGTGRLFVNDVGQNTWEEIDEVAVGRNYGWPVTEGYFDQATYPGFTQPFYAYDHGGAEPNGIAITGGIFYEPPAQQFPDDYRGDYFFADYGSSKIWRVDGTTRVVTEFASQANAPVDFKVDAAGNLYYLAHSGGRVLRVSYADAPPSITDQPDSRTVTTGSSVTFAVTASGQGPLAYQWQRANPGQTFTPITGATSASYTLGNAQSADNGDRFRVGVTDANGRATTSSAATLTVTANRAPSATINISAGLRNAKFDAGKLISFGGSATDPEQGTLASGAFTWQVDYLTSIKGGDADGDGLPGITRPFVQPFGNTKSGSFLPATTGPYTLTDVAYVVTLRVADSGGLSDVERFVINPNTVNLTLATNRSGLRVTVDGQPFTSPRTFGSVVGFRRPIGVSATTQTLGGTSYAFSSWSDGGAATHTVTTPATSTTYTATFRSAASPFGAKVNFQNGSSQGFAGYRADTGAAFGARGGGLSFGWNANNNANARNRNVNNSPDERYDTLNHLQKPGGATKWEISVPNGTYRVRLVAGDPYAYDSVYRINVEGKLTINATPNASRRWIEGTVTVTVTDGRLTLSNATGASNNKVMFVEITGLA